MESKSTDILLVGKTGYGKSATANSIVGYDAFKSKMTFESVTKVAQFEYGEFEGRILKVVDSPGIADTSRDKEEAVKLVVDAMTFAVAANPQGYHALLLVGTCTTRFTKEDTKTVKMLKKIFGQDFIKFHSILLMTHGDVFTKKCKTETFDDWISKEKGVIQELIKECDGRVICFDNETTDMNTKTEQNRKLLKMIDSLAVHGKRYTSDIFAKGKEARDSLLKKSKRQQLSEEDLMECGLITQQLARINYETPETVVLVLENLKTRADLLEQRIRKQDQGSNSLQVAITLVKQLKESIIEQMKGVDEVIRRKQQMKQLELELKLECSSLDAEEKRQREAERIEQDSENRKQEDERRKREDERRRQEEKNRKHEDECRRQEDFETEHLREAHIQEELDRQKKEYEKLMKQMEEEKLKEERRRQEEQQKRHKDERRKQEDESRRQEEERRRQADMENETLRYAQLQEELERQKKEHKKLMKQKEEERLKEEQRRQEEERRRQEDEYRRQEDERRKQEERRRDEEDRKRQKNMEKQKMRMKQREEELERQRKEYEMLMKQKEEDKLKEMESIKSTYNSVKEQESWTWGDVASVIAAPVVSVVSWWWGKK